MEREYTIFMPSDQEAELWDLTDLPEETKQVFRKTHGRVIGSDLEAEDLGNVLWDENGKPIIKLENLWEEGTTRIKGKIYWFGLCG